MKEVDFKKEMITSAAGTRIGYRSIGAGPGVILLHGALQSSLNFTILARALSDHFTVYIPDRRGRGLSDAYSTEDALETEAHDILALIHHTGTANIFGLSSGAIISLQAALLTPALKKMALYEPPIPVSGDPFKRLHKTYEKAIRKGNAGRAFIAILKGTGDTSFLSWLPAFMTAPVINMMMKAQMKNRVATEIPLQLLVTLFHYDRLIIKASPPLVTGATALQAEVLLMGGGKSKKYFQWALDRLNVSLPNAQRIVFKNQGHMAADNTESPLQIAAALIPFFKTQ